MEAWEFLVAELPVAAPRLVPILRKARYGFSDEHVIKDVVLEMEDEMLRRNQSQDGVMDLLLAIFVEDLPKLILFALISLHPPPGLFPLQIHEELEEKAMPPLEFALALLRLYTSPQFLYGFLNYALDARGERFVFQPATALRVLFTARLPEEYGYNRDLNSDYENYVIFMRNMERLLTRSQLGYVNELISLFVELQIAELNYTQGRRFSMEMEIATELPDLEPDASFELDPLIREILEQQAEYEVQYSRIRKESGSRSGVYCCS